MFLANLTLKLLLNWNWFEILIKKHILKILYILIIKTVWRVIMIKSKNYSYTRFSVDVIIEAYDLFISKLDNSITIDEPYTLSLGVDDEDWEYDTIEVIFYLLY